VNPDGNPGGTFYAFKATTGSIIKYVNALGQLEDDPVYIAVTSLTLSGGIPNSLYSITLEAADAGDGTGASGFGPSASATTLAAIPTAVSYETVFSTQITLDWDANDNPDGTEYYAEISPDSNFISNVTNSGWVTTVGHIFTGLLPDTTYYARVKARNDNLVETSYVSFGSASTPAGPDTVKAIRVRDLIAERGFLIEWQPNLETDIAGYNVYRSSSPTDLAEFNKLNSSLINSNVRTFIDRVPYTFGLVWYYKVTAVDDGGNESSLQLTSPVHDNTFHSFEEQPFPNIVTAGDFIKNEVPTGTINGVNLLFTTKFPYQPKSVEIFQDGVKLRLTTDYVEGPMSQQITLVNAPLVGTDLRVQYTRYGTGL
jgi:fibronectin type 3 domain-containing protein